MPSLSKAVGPPCVRWLSVSFGRALVAGNDQSACFPPVVFSGVGRWSAQRKVNSATLFHSSLSRLGMDSDLPAREKLNSRLRMVFLVPLGGPSGSVTDGFSRYQVSENQSLTQIGRASCREGEWT